MDVVDVDQGPAAAGPARSGRVRWFLENRKTIGGSSRRGWSTRAAGFYLGAAHLWKLFCVCPGRGFELLNNLGESWNVVEDQGVGFVPKSTGSGGDLFPKPGLAAEENYVVCPGSGSGGFDAGPAPRARALVEWFGGSPWSSGPAVGERPGMGGAFGWAYEAAGGWSA